MAELKAVHEKLDQILARLAAQQSQIDKLLASRQSEHRFLRSHSPSPATPADRGGEGTDRKSTSRITIRRFEDPEGSGHWVLVSFLLDGEMTILTIARTPTDDWNMQLLFRYAASDTTSERVPGIKLPGDKPLPIEKIEAFLAETDYRLYTYHSAARIWNSLRSLASDSVVPKRAIAQDKWPAIRFE